MVRKEIWTALLAYNLIRKTILEAAYDADVSPRELSFTAAMQAIAAGWTAILLLDDAGQIRLVDLYLHNLAGYPVGHRPDRIEPRHQAASETAPTAHQTAPPRAGQTSCRGKAATLTPSDRRITRRDKEPSAIRLILTLFFTRSPSDVSLCALTSLPPSTSRIISRTVHHSAPGPPWTRFP